MPRKRKRARKKVAKVCSSPHHCHPRCKGYKMLLLGAIILCNALYAWWPWEYFIGMALVIFGALKLIIGGCWCKNWR